MSPPADARAADRAEDRAGDRADVPPDVVDLRSDTVTRPTPAMREAMAAATVGDDALDGDPTTRLLEETIGELLGMERALFFPSGIMANQTALAVLAGWGGEVICEAGAHVFHYEEGAAAALAGVQLRPIPTSDGILRAEAMEAGIRAGSRYLPRTRAVTLENTHLESGGRVMSVADLAEVAGAAAEHGLPVHLDGARLWHAVAETRTPPAEWTRHCRTAMVALSKGLGAPVGSVLAGPGDVLEEAWRVRRRLGGQMRQSGVLAAAGLHALRHHRERLVEDHRDARRLAGAFDRIDGLSAGPPETNILLVEVDPSFDREHLLEYLERRHIRLLPFGPARLRAVTHLDVGTAGTERVVEALDRYEPA